MTPRRCAGPCGRELPLDAEYFLLMPTPRRVRRVTRAFSRKCHSCRSIGVVAAAQRRKTEQRSVNLSRKTIRCIGPCGKEKAACEKNFAQRPNGVYFNRCRVCEKMRLREYRRGPAYRRWRKKKNVQRRMAENRKRFVARHPESARASTERSRERDTPEVFRARNLLGKALRAGVVVRPPRCEWRFGCRVGGTDENGRARLRAHFHRGHEHPLDVKFYCCRHRQIVTSEGRNQEEKMEREEDRLEEKREAALEARRATARRLDGDEPPTVAALEANLRPRKFLGERMGEAVPEPRPGPSEAAWAASAMSREEVAATPWVRAWLAHAPGVGEAPGVAGLFALSTPVPSP